MIELKNITFSYERREQGGLRNINLTVKNGECILLCGRSGCGKTTITRLVNGLIPRFYDGELTGQVVIDGKDIADLTMYEISEKVGRQLSPVLCVDYIKKPVDNFCGMKNHRTGKKGCTAPTWSCRMSTLNYLLIV